MLLSMTGTQTGPHRGIPLNACQGLIATYNLFRKDDKEIAESKQISSL